LLDFNKTMIKLLIASIFLFVILGCSVIISPNTNIEFVVINTSKNSVDWVKVYAGDYDKGTHKSSNFKEVLSFGNLKSGDSSSVKSFNVKQFSESGNGTMKVFALKSNSKDTLKTGAGNYEKFVLSQEFAPSNWRTFQIIVSEKEYLQTSLSLYEKGKFVKKF
jgi:hypothetical protein